MHRTRAKHIVRHMQKSVVQWSVKSEFTCISMIFLLATRPTRVRGSSKGLTREITVKGLAYYQEGLSHSYKTNKQCIPEVIHSHACIKPHTSVTRNIFKKRCRQGLSQDFRNACPNSNFKISARPDLATNLLKICITATFNSIERQKGQFILKWCPRRWFAIKIFVYCPPKVKIEKSS